MFKSTTAHWLALLLSTFFVLSACRLADVMTQLSSHTPTAVAQAPISETGTVSPAGNTQTPVANTTATRSRKTKASTRTPTSEVAMLMKTIAALQTQSWFPTALPEENLPPDETEDPNYDPNQDPGTPAPVVSPRTFVMPASAATATSPVDATETDEPTPTDEPTETPQPTPEFRYQVTNPYCGPNWKTFVEGTLTEGGEPVDGLLVRISTNNGGDPAWTDYVSGADPEKPGGYTQIIDANGPHEGLWYVWVVDPETKKRISEIATIKTDRVHVEDTAKSPGSCQSATIDFSSDYPSEQPTQEPYLTATPLLTATRTRTYTPTRTGTVYTSTPTRTGTVYTSTPTRTGTVYTSTPTRTWTPTRTPTSVPTTPNATSIPPATP